MVNGGTCTEGLYFCGATLIEMGYLPEQIAQAGGSSDSRITDNTLFYCVGGPEGLIMNEATCSDGCVSRGANDQCA